jgi:hypothetical protein
MKLFKRLIFEEKGQGLVEYTLMVLLVALVFWVAISSCKGHRHRIQPVEVGHRNCGRIEKQQEDNSG